MEVKKHIVFGDANFPELLQYLKRNEIPFEEGSPVVLDISENDPHWPFICDYVKKNNVFCLSETHFTKSELKEAQWLTVRSQWRNGYPQPEDSFRYETITYKQENHCKECGSGLVQVEAFRIKKEPKWGKRHFMMLNWVEDELFINEHAKSMLQEAELSGIEFCPVKSKNGKEVLPNVYQLVISHTLEEGIESKRPSIDEIQLCPCCGVIKYHTTGIGMLAFQKDIFRNAPDIMKTAEVFGWGHYAPRIILISQRLYRFLTINHLDRGLIFEPIELV